jgi:hypothetical protein
MAWAPEYGLGGKGSRASPTGLFYAAARRVASGANADYS